jgi:threonine dehydratase
LTVEGDVFAETLAASMQRASNTGALNIHAFDHDHVVAGQGTLAIELAEQAPDLDTVLVAVGGGGFIAGISAWYAGRVKVVAVEPEGSPTYALARQAGRPVDVKTGGLAADSLGCRRIGTIPFSVAQHYVAESLVVPEDSIRAAQRLLWNELRVIAEPGGAVALAALVSGQYIPTTGERLGIIVCGGNASLEL